MENLLHHKYNLLHILGWVFIMFAVVPLSSEEEQGSFSEHRVVSLDLSSAISLALKNNLQLKNSQDIALNAEYQVVLNASEFDWEFVPSGDLGYVGGGYAGSGTAMGTGIKMTKKIPQGTLIDLNPGIQKVNRVYHTDINARITQPLLRGFGREYNLSGIKAAQFSYRSALRSYFIAQCQLIVRTTICLYEIIKSQRALELNLESFERVKKFFHSAQLKSKIGLSDPLDVYRAETEMRQAEDALNSAKERMEEAEDSLRDLLALPMDAQLKIDLPVFYSPITVNFEQALTFAMNNRVELDQAKDQECEHLRLSCVAKERLWPELNLVLNYSNCGRHQVFSNSCFRRRETTWGIGLTTSADFDPEAETLAFDQSVLAIEASRRGVQQIRSNIVFELKKALRQLERARERIELQEQQIHTSLGEVKLSYIKFERGLANNFDLIQSEKTLRNAQINHWNALVDHVVGEFMLRGVLGLLLEKPRL